MIIFQIGISRNITKSNLNAGSGNACAGHWRLIELVAVLVRIKPSVANENLGLAPPMGSVKCYFAMIKIY